MNTGAREDSDATTAAAVATTTTTKKRILFSSSARRRFPPSSRLALLPFFAVVLLSFVVSPPSSFFFAPVLAASGEAAEKTEMQKKAEEKNAAGAAARGPSREKVTFFNFSPQEVPIYWIDRNDPMQKPVEAGTAEPYRPLTTETYAGHIFAYPWGPRRYDYTVRETPSSNPQIVMMGNANVTPESHEEYRKLVQDGVIKAMPEEVSVLCAFSSASAAKEEEKTGGDDEPTKKEEEKTDGDNKKAPPAEEFIVPFMVNVQPYWSPYGAARFLELISIGYYDGVALNRVVPKFLTQFGIGANHELKTMFRDSPIPDDPSHKIPFRPGIVSYAGSGQNSRTAEIFFVMPDTEQPQLDEFGKQPWETPFAYINPDQLKNVVDHVYDGYGDMSSVSFN